MNLLAAEVLKLRTTRVPYLLVAVIAVLSGVSAAALVGSGALDDDEQPALSLAEGAGFSAILVLVVGILIVTNEYRHGTVNSTFLYEPNRLRVLVAKLGAGVVGGLVTAAAAAAGSLAVAVPWLALRDEPVSLAGSLGEAVVRLAAVYVLNCMLGVALGAVLQSQVGAIVAALGWFLIGESVVSVVAGALGEGVGEPDSVSRYLPGSALGGILGFSQGEGSDEYLLAPLASTLLALAYVAGLSLLGALSMSRRDP